jgi:uncharacterized membrane protein YphA (DoxX/SURF4 family)
MSEGIAKSSVQPETASGTSAVSDQKRGTLEMVAVLARWFLGGLFVYMGLVKALDPKQFLELVHQYQMVSSPLILNSIAAALPWFEVFCGLLLLAGVAVRGTALMLLLMLVPFTIIVLRRALFLASTKGLALCAVQFDCGCGMGEVVACHKILENCLLIFLSAWLLTGRGRQFCLRFSLFGNLPAL